MLTVGAQPEADIAARALVISEHFAQHKAEGKYKDVPNHYESKNARALAAFGLAERIVLALSPKRAPLGNKPQAQGGHQYGAEHCRGIARRAVIAPRAPKGEHGAQRRRAEGGY